MSDSTRRVVTVDRRKHPHRARHRPGGPVTPPAAAVEAASDTAAALAAAAALARITGHPGAAKLHTAARAAEHDARQARQAWWGSGGRKRNHPANVPGMTATTRHTPSRAHRAHHVAETTTTVLAWTFLAVTVAFLLVALTGPRYGTATLGPALAAGGVAALVVPPVIVRHRARKEHPHL